ncbi:unnamed protein product [Leptosia nina]|uniref:Lipase n=1 Tax=Leptosia nina TaxID=320188 RepID=A0AAV1IZ66_9NEOP
MNFVFAVFFALIVICNAQILPKEAYATVPQLITSAGYPVNKHRVTTSDGYILQIYRIPAGRRTARRTDNVKGKKAVLLVHGLLGSSDNFLLMGPDRSLAYMLADAGYDVWLGNLRGTQYSGHQNLTRRDANFWKFSFEEHGKYDVPAMIDKILSITKLDKILYIGHSMGTTSFFVMMSERPEYNEKVVAFVGLAPAVYVGNMEGISQFFLNDLGITKRMREQGIYSTDFAKWPILANSCIEKSAQANICVQFNSYLMGNHNEPMDMNMYPVWIARVQPGAWQQFEHYAKVAITKVFTAWEGGINGSVKPYNLSNVKVPVTLLYGESDRLTQKAETLKLADQLKANGVLEEVRPACPCSKWNHIDFLFAKDVGRDLNKPLIRTVNKLYKKYGSL